MQNKEENVRSNRSGCREAGLRDRIRWKHAAAIIRRLRSRFQITGIDEESVRRLNHPHSLSSIELIDLEKLEELCRRTATLHVEQYPWFYVPNSLHRS